MQGNIIRHHQLTLMNTGLEYPLTLLVAAAGSGKSTLIKQWQPNNTEKTVIHIEVSARLAQGQSLFKKILKELRHSVPIWDASIFSLFNSENSTSTKVLLNTLIFAFESITENLVVVLDNFHLIQCSETQEILYNLINELPRNVQFIIASRRYPDFSLSSMKLKEQIFIIDGDDLKLSPIEVETLNQHLGGEQLTTARLSTLIHQTQGWLVGIKFALLAYRKTGNSALDTFSGTQPELLTYFGYEVLTNLPCVVQDFVMRTALFDSFNSDICETVLKVENAAHMLHILSSQELLLVADNCIKGHYRYHPLLHEFLKEQVKLKLNQKAISNIHKNSSEYFLRDKKHLLALRHAAQTRDQDYYFSVIRSSCDHWLRDGKFSQIIDLIEQLNEAQVKSDADLLVTITYALIFSRRFNQAHYYLDLLKQQDNIHPQELDSQLSHSAFIKHTLLLFQREDNAFTDPKVARLASHHSNIDIRALSTMILAYERIYRGQFQHAFQLAHEAKTLVKETGHRFLASYAELMIISCDRYLCRGGNAIQNMTSTFTSTSVEDQSPAWVNLASGMMVVHYEKNESELALNFSEKLLPTVNYTCATEVITNVYLLSSRLLHVKGNHQKATKLLIQLERILSLGHYGRFQSQVIQEKMRQAIAAKQLSIADDIYHNNKLHLFLKADVFSKPKQYEESRERYALACVYWLASQQQFTAAELILKQLVSSLDTLGIKYRALIARGNLLVIQASSGAKENALNQLVLLVQKYGVQCFSRSVFDEAPGLQQIFKDALQTQRLQLPKAYLAVFSDILLNSNNTLCDVKPQALLTDKELDIFRLLGGGLSNAEISNKASIALSTTKWHLKNIYSKLGIENRRAAVILASQW